MARLLTKHLVHTVRNLQGFCAARNLVGRSAFSAVGCFSQVKFGQSRAELRSRRYSNTSSDSHSYPDLSLHLYEHCPYCVRVQLALGWKGIPYETIIYGYGDTLGDSKGKYYGGRTLTGHKALPVLEIHERTPSLMAESSIIMAYLDGLGTRTAPQVIGSLRTDLEAFAKGDFKTAQRTLCRPISHGGGLNVIDFAKPEDIEYAREKYTSQGFDYEAAKAPEAQKKARADMEQYLVTLESMMQSENYMTGSSYSFDDIFILPELKTVSMVPDLKWPDKLLKYFNTALGDAKVKSFFS